MRFTLIRVLLQAWSKILVSWCAFNPRPPAFYTSLFQLSIQASGGLLSGGGNDTILAHNTSATIRASTFILVCGSPWGGSPFISPWGRNWAPNTHSQRWSPQPRTVKPFVVVAVTTCSAVSIHTLAMRSMANLAQNRSVWPCNGQPLRLPSGTSPAPPSAP